MTGAPARGVPGPAAEALALARRLARLEEGAIRRGAAARALAALEPERALLVVLALVRASGGAEARAAWSAASSTARKSSSGVGTAPAIVSPRATTSPARTISTETFTEATRAGALDSTVPRTKRSGGPRSRSYTPLRTSCAVQGPVPPPRSSAPRTLEGRSEAASRGPSDRHTKIGRASCRERV